MPSIVYFYCMNVQDLFDAIRDNNEKLVDGILCTNPDWINQTDSRGSSPLLLATYHGFHNLSQLILNHQADINAQDKVGNTALMGVCFKHHNDIAKMLIDRGADINATNNMGANALIYCAQFNNEEIAQLLLDKGADKNLKDENGHTAADHARLQGLNSLALIIEEY